MSRVGGGRGFGGGGERSDRSTTFGRNQESSICEIKFSSLTKGIKRK